MDIKQDKSTGFLTEENGDLVEITQSDAIAQDITRSIRTFKRECFRNQAVGIDYFNDVFVSKSQGCFSKAQRGRGMIKQSAIEANNIDTP